MKKPFVVKTSNQNNKLGVLTITDILNQQHTPDMSVSKIKINGVNNKVKNIRCNSAYLVIKGKGKFLLSGKEVKVKPGDLVYIPKGNWYQDSGKMTMLSFKSPAFSPEQEEKVIL